MKPEYSGEKLRQEDIFTIGQLDVTKTSGCPFRNLLEFASCYVKMAKEKDLRTFKFFLGRSDGIYTDEFPKEYSSVMMENFIFSFVEKSERACFPATWMEFKEDDLNILIKTDPFFEDYVASCEKIEKKGHFPNLELYIFTKLQSIACICVSEDMTCSVWNSWCKNDLLQSIYYCGFNETISNVYEKYGKDWFCHFRYSGLSFDPVFYKYAFYAVSSAYCCDKSKELVLHDLKMLRSEFNIAITATAIDDDERNKKFVDDISEFIKMVEEETSNSDNEVTGISRCTLVGSTLGVMLGGPIGGILGTIAGTLLGSSKIRSWMLSVANDFTHLNPQLVSDDTTKKKTKDALDAAIKEVEGDNAEKNASTTDVASLAVAAIGQNGRNNEDYDNSIKNTLPLLSEEACENIGAAFCLFQGGYYSHAANILAQCVEVEANRNIFIPFRDNVRSNDKKMRFSSDNTVKKTEMVLVDEKSVTLGSLKFLGRLLKLEDYGNSSLVRRFASEVGENVNTMSLLCDSIFENDIGSDGLSIIEIRNAITHQGGKRATILRNGNKIVVYVDEKCFGDVKSYLFEKPIDLMSKIRKIGLGIRREPNNKTNRNNARNGKHDFRKKKKKNGSNAFSCSIGDQWSKELSKIV